LRTFVPLGLRQQIWDYALASATATDVQERQPFLDTTLPSLLKVFAKIKDENSLASAIDIAYVDRARLEIDPVDALRGTAERLISTGKWKDASEKIKSGGFRGEVDKQHPDRLDALAHRVSGYVMKTASIAESYDFLQNLYDGEFKQDAFLLFAGKSVQQGKASDLWNLVLKARDLNAVDRAATYRGFVSAFGPESNSLPGGLGVPAVPTGAE
ncbi:MAG: hypothetical protein KDA36_12175, partial [Planctomycetaceae bacterium]|nr:hypothetical protein [Planctomycetaceae bacterium]